MTRSRMHSSEDPLSPNHDSREGAAVDMLILHYTGMAVAEDALERLCDPAAKVSAHWFVHEDGRVVALVPEARRAWHAGVSCWSGTRDINSRSIGIEIHNPGHDHGYADFPDRQIASVISLSREIVGRYPIAPTRVLAHSDVAPGRKMDPGEKFPWQRLHEAGVGHWVAPAPAERGPVLRSGDQGEAARALQSALAAYGYGIAADGIYGSWTETVVTAFQRHFRPARVDGVADISTRITLERLIAAQPSDDLSI